MRTKHVRNRKNLYRKLTILGVSAAVAIAGVHWLATSQAATPSASIEAESGTIAGNNKILLQQAGASGSGSVRFGGGEAASCDQAGIQKIVDSVSASSLEAYLRKLVQDDSKPTPNELISRHVSSPGNQIKVDWAKQQYTAMGLQVVNQAFTSGGFNLNNAVGRLAGSNPNVLYAVGGHIDAINSQDENVAGDPAPGAIDDGSGVVVAMEAARVLKPFQSCLKSTIDFIGFNDEEEDSGGADKYIADLSGKTLKGVYNVDMVSYSPGGVMCDIHRYDDATRDKPLADKLAAVNTKYGVNLQMSAEAYHEDDTDTWNFWNAGMSALYTNECTTDDNYPGYHSTDDTIKYVNFEALAKNTKIFVAALAELASQ